MRSFLFSVVLFSQSLAFAQIQPEDFWARSGLSIVGDYEYVTGTHGERNFVRSVYKQTQNLLSRFPPSEWIYVGVGRSGAAVVAELRVLAEQNSSIEITTLPWSSVREIKSDLDKNITDFADEYLRKSLPVSNKKIVFIDYVQMGESILGFDSFVRDILEPGKFGYYLMLAPSRSFLMNLILKRQLPHPVKAVALSSRDPMYMALQQQNLDPYAEVLRYPIKAEYLAKLNGTSGSGYTTDLELSTALVDYLRYANEKFGYTKRVAVNMCRALFSL